MTVSDQCGPLAFATSTGLQQKARSYGATSPRRASYRLSADGGKASARISAVQRRLPMALTWSRVVVTPVLAAAYLAPPFAYQRAISVGLFAFSAFTDLLDGILARRWNVCSRMGAFLDPVADKLLVCAALVCVTARLNIPVLPPATAVILCREIFVSALREWMAAYGQRDTVQVGFLGKVKTTAQMVALIALLAAPTASSLFAVVGSVALVVAAVLSVVSAAGYVRAALPVMLETDE